LSISGVKQDQKSGSQKTSFSTGRSTIGSSINTKERLRASWVTGSTSLTRRWLYCCCSISFRVIAFAARSAFAQRIPLARQVARKALAAGFDEHVDRDLRVFFYLPFSHSEDLADQEVALAKNKALGAPYLQHAQGHHDIVRTFGRFPHRNEIFGRETTQAEREFLDNGGFKG
jgi:hypothetical protein